MLFTEEGEKLVLRMALYSAWPLIFGLGALGLLVALVASSALQGQSLIILFSIVMSLVGFYFRYKHEFLIKEIADKDGEIRGALFKKEYHKESEMVWTEKTPTEPGFYWLEEEIWLDNLREEFCYVKEKNEFKAIVQRIVRVYDTGWYKTPDIRFVYCEDDIPYEFSSIWALKWCGPIKIPNY